MREKPVLDNRCAVLGTGSALPKRIVTNDELAGIVSNYDTSSGDFALWVDKVTHIQERRFIDPTTESAGTLGLEAARKAIDAAGIEAEAIDHVIMASFTYHDMFPGEHTRLVHALGISAGVFNLAAACAGSLWAMTLARSLVQSGQCENVLVVGVETLSRVLDLRDPITAILFGDAAGAVVIGRKDDGEPTGFFGQSVHHLNFTPDNIVMWNANVPLPEHLKDNPDLQSRAFLGMRGGPRVLRNAVNAMASSVCEALGFTMSDLRADHPQLREMLDRMRLVPHQANGRIIEAVKDKLGLSDDRVYRTVYHAGNSSTATNVLTLDYAVRKGNLWREPPPEGSDHMGIVTPIGRTLQKGDLVVVTSIGAGYLFGALAFVHSG